LRGGGGSKNKSDCGGVKRRVNCRGKNKEEENTREVEASSDVHNLGRGKGRKKGAKSGEEH